MADETKNGFISHIHEDDEGIRNLKNLLGKHGFQLRDSSIRADRPNNASNPDYIKSEILAPRIKWAGTFIVYISPGTRESEWVNWEIEYAQKQEKRIVGVWEHGAAECDIPEALEKYADAVVGWNSDRIVAAITGEINSWSNSNGELRSQQPIKRYRC